MGKIVVRSLVSLKKEHDSKLYSYSKRNCSTKLKESQSPQTCYLNCVESHRKLDDSETQNKLGTIWNIGIQELLANNKTTTQTQRKALWGMSKARILTITSPKFIISKNSGNYSLMKSKSACKKQIIFNLFPKLPHLKWPVRRVY